MFFSLSPTHYKQFTPHHTRDNQHSYCVEENTATPATWKQKCCSISRCPSPFHPLRAVIIRLLNTSFMGEIKSIKGHYLEGGTTKKSRKNILGLKLDSMPTSSSPEKRKFRKNPVFETKQKDHLNLLGHRWLKHFIR